jgi:hypothetical protein
MMRDKVNYYYGPYSNRVPVIESPKTKKANKTLKRNMTFFTKLNKLGFDVKNKLR